MTFNRSGIDAGPSRGQTYRYEDGNYLAGLGVFHALHCVVSLLTKTVISKKSTSADRPSTTSRTKCASYYTQKHTRSSTACPHKNCTKVKFSYHFSNLCIVFFKCFGKIDIFSSSQPIASTFSANTSHATQIWPPSGRMILGIGVWCFVQARSIRVVTSINYISGLCGTGRKMRIAIEVVCFERSCSVEEDLAEVAI